MDNSHVREPRLKVIVDMRILTRAKRTIGAWRRPGCP